MAHVPRLYHPGPLEPGPLTLGGEASKRLTTVMRLAPGDPFLVFAGDGHEWHARLTSTARGNSIATVEGLARQGAPPAVVLETWIGVIRTNRLETAIEKCVEAGADIIRLVNAAYSQRGDAPSDTRGERWRRIIVEAAEQSGRLWLPVLEPPQPLSRMIETFHGALVVADQHGRGAPELAPLLPRSGHLALVTGPEGGLAPEELELLRRKGALPMTLGPYILRAETAAIAGTAQLRALTFSPAGG